MPERNKLTASDIDSIIHAYESGEHGTDIANRFGIIPATVYYHLKRHGITIRKKPGRWPAISNEIIDAVVRDYTTKNTDGTWTGAKTLQKRYGISDSVIWLYLQKRGIPIRDSKESHSGGKACKPIINVPAPDEVPPLCRCGCSQPVPWNRRRNRWNRYLRGHNFSTGKYRDYDWLFHEFVNLHRTQSDIASACDTSISSVRRSLIRFGLLPGCVLTNGMPREQSRSRTWLDMMDTVIARDGSCCKICGARQKPPDVILHVHHIKSWKDYPAERFNVENLVTFCQTCHLWVHSRANVNHDFLG